jgi:mannose-1-phosphate guanylyltransferase
VKQVVHGTLKATQQCVGVIMAGGSGTRFWPLSRTNFPKQFLPLAGGDRSLIQATADRIEPLTGMHGVLVVTAAHQADAVVAQLPAAAVLAEPSARNTAACIGFAAAYLLDTVGDLPMVCLPADHIVHGHEAILAVYQRAITLATSKDVLVTIGIRPTLPETGYGYIEAAEFAEDGVAAVRSFVEKPNRETAERYLAAGSYFWNSGMFVWRPSVILSQIEKHLPRLYTTLSELRAELASGASFERVAELYNEIEQVSIDVGVMECADNVVMLSGDGFMWSDVGSWSSWADTRRPAAENRTSETTVIEGDGVAVACSGVTVLAKQRFVAAVGLRDVIIVDTDDALLVCGRDDAQRVKDVVQYLSDNNRKDLL